MSCCLPGAFARMCLSGLSTLFDSPPWSNAMCEMCIEQGLTAGRETCDVQPLYAEAPPLSDWHRADILAAVKKKGGTIVRLSTEAGLAPGTLSNVFTTPWPKGERIIARFIGIPACQIWPERYRRRRPRISRKASPYEISSGP
ncbi:helix-turn-helix domain-containing protein [Pantoea agglomerans]|uniref:helix-turn-helix domain-containing protein n=2 Tax=Enterobacter agglomerans TaxID=549 RepID=UPI0027D7B268|nr:helix-turn-helix domain-containing protein [Pantoea agglomerans]